MHTTPDISLISAWFQGLQQTITLGLEALDGQAKFRSDIWQRAEGGGGDTRVIENGRILEKGGVNFSHVHGPMPEKIANRLQLTAGDTFHATGISLVIHPSHPLIPVIHMNLRFFLIPGKTYWFGGGIDVTPAYVFPEDAQWFHRYMAEVCAPFGDGVYPEYKAACDRYFYLRHRAETRGIGGLFFDFLKPGERFHTLEQIWAFVQAVGNAFLPVYSELIVRHQDKAYMQGQKDFQLWRRSRYVEFNLLYDKGTSFGLDTGGRTESILMSLPPLVEWKYNYSPAPGSVEAISMSYLQAIDWLSFSQ